MKYSFHEKEDYYGYIYITLDQKHNKIYVGQKKGNIEKSKDYFGSGTIIRRIINKYGTYFLKKTILGVCYSKEELTFWETECKHFFKALDKKYGYNILEKDTFGDTFTYQTEEDKKIIRDKLSLSGKKRKGVKKKKHSLEANLKKSQRRKGITFSVLHRKNLSIAATGRINSKESNEKNRIKHLNKKMSVESKEKNSIKHRGDKNESYVTINYEFLIIEYFKNLDMKTIIKNYNENNVNLKNINTYKYKQFLKILNFPINVMYINQIKQKETYLKFIEENKLKIDWYIENYKNLENYYFEYRRLNKK